MSGLVGLALIVMAGFGLFGLVWWIERSTRRPGLAAFIGGFLVLIGAAASLSVGQRLLPLIFALQALIFFYQAYDKWSVNRRTNGNGA
jgi:CHASE2 domain-containing sensor protein